ncbi:MAG TPA: peptide ABC transporter substrate-binding protein [Verrucomicrobiae bacterium]|jgi:peptide/nickel transport system substrate-binding protein|nr:peptide ABC transporter substrate-binding protein [Verrucomicrobiae bacterium]
MNYFRQLVCIALCAAVFAGCTRAQTGGNGTGRNSWTIPGTLRLGEPDQPDSLNPLYSNDAAADLTFGLIFSYVLRFDQYGNYFPDLATAVPSLTNGGISKDQKTITIHLRRDAKWADGTALTSADWMFTYRAVFNKANNVKTQYGWDDIASARAPDPYTIVIRLRVPSVAVLGILGPGGSGYPPLPAHILARYADLNRVSFNNAPLSSGPYVLTKWTHDSSLNFAPNPYYFRGKPGLKKIVWSVIPNASTLFTQLRTHEIDVYAAVNENSIQHLHEIQGITIDKRLVANWRHLQFNTNRPFLHDVRVRLAIAEAVDWKNINDTVYHGYNLLATSDVFPQSWAAPTIPRYPYDVANAKRLLKAAGWTPGPDGIMKNAKGAKLQLYLSSGTNKPENAQAEVVIQGMLRQAGFDIQIRNYPVNVLFARTGPLYTGNYDMEWTVYLNGNDPDNSGNWAGSEIPPHGANTSWLRDPIVDQTSLAAERTFDQAVRKRLYQREEERIHQLVPAVFFYWENQYTATNSDVKNYDPAAFLLDSWNSWQWSI